MILLFSSYLLVDCQCFIIYKVYFSNISNILIVLYNHKYIQHF